ncbi:MAG: hypothetical protein OES84_02815 [Kiritimatiellaceae bacterium]|nr:hypothetical protein [Kiritimatiellaceae bacterium]
MKIKLFKPVGLLLSVFVLVVSGCSHTLLPSVERIGSAKIPYAAFSSSIHVVNDQPNDEEVLIGTLTGGRKYYASLHEWTALAVLALQQEVTQRGASISSDSTKVIKMRISNVSLRDGGGGRRKHCAVTLQIETGDGVKKVFTGSEISGGHKSRVAGSGVTLALTEMLRDRQILNYMK